MKRCPVCNTSMEDSQQLCPSCGTDYLSAVIDDISAGAAADTEMLLDNLEDGLSAMDHAPLPTVRETLRRMSPVLCGIALAFCLHRRLACSVIVSALSLRTAGIACAAVALRRVFSAALVAVLASRVPGGVNLSLELVKLRLLLAGQAPALVPGAVHNRLLPGNHFLNVHCFLTS